MRWLPQGPLGPPPTLAAYAAMGYWSRQGVALEARVELLIQQFSAELSSCTWCVHQARHRWSKAFLPERPLAELRGYSTSPEFSERERAALALTEAVASYRSGDPSAERETLARARRHFGEAEVARIVQAAASEHFFNPATGGLGLEARGGETASDAAGHQAPVPWRAIASGIVVRGWL